MEIVLRQKTGLRGLDGGQGRSANLEPRTNPNKPQNWKTVRIMQFERWKNW